MNVVPKEVIEREAREAAERGLSLDEACPYPWGSDAAHHFKAVYLLALPRTTSSTTIASATAGQEG